MADRYVIADTDALRQLHGHARGVIHNPFDKRLHHAGCEFVSRMTATQRKWFFPTYDEAQPYLEKHYSRTSGEWKCCSSCTPGAARPADPDIYLPLVSAGRASAPAARS